MSRRSPSRAATRSRRGSYHRGRRNRRRDRPARCRAHPRTPSPPRSPSRTPRPELGDHRAGIGECIAVEFSCGRQRNGIEFENDGRNHMRGKMFRCLTGNLAEVEAGTHSTVHIRHQLRLTRRCRTPHRHREIHTRTRRQHRIDLTELDAETTHLHLEVVTPHIHDPRPSIPRAPHHVTGPIHSRTARSRHEPRRRQPRTTVIPPSYTRARQIQLTRHTRRNRVQARIQHLPNRISNGNTDRDLLPRHQRIRHRDHDRRLRRAVHIEEPTTRRPPRHQIGRTRLPADCDTPEHIQPGRVHRRQRRRRDERMGNTMTHNKICEIRTAVDRRRRHHHRR